MLKLLYVLSVSAIVFAGGCRPAAAPVSIGNKPVSINGMKLSDAPPDARKPVPEMSWTGFDGAVFKLKDYRGKAVILDFWATFCPPCIEEIPHLNALQARYGPDNLAIIGLHVGGEEDKAKVPEFVRRLAIAYPLGYPDSELTLFVFGSSDALPQTAIFDREGKMIGKITGFNDRIREELDRTVEKALATNE